MPIDLALIRSSFDKASARRDLLAKQRDDAKTRAEESEGMALRTESGRDIVNAVLSATQQNVVGFVEEVVSLALSTVYGDGYRFELEFDIKRNQSEATPWIVKGENKFSPREEVGGGVLDVVSLALRLAFWALTEPKPAPVFVLDEPGRFLSEDKQPSFGRMLKEVSEMLGVQIVMVSHSQRLIERADRAYQVTQESGVSRVEEIEG